jgi:hypothetical protein
MYVEIIPLARPVRTRVAGTRGEADDGSCGIRAVHGAGGRRSPGRNALRNMLKGQVLPYLEDRVRLDLVPLED